MCLPSAENLAVGGRTADVLFSNTAVHGGPRTGARIQLAVLEFNKSTAVLEFNKSVFPSQLTSREPMGWVGGGVIDQGVVSVGRKRGCRRAPRQQGLSPIKQVLSPINLVYQ